MAAASVVLLLLLCAYLIVIRYYRYKRSERIVSGFGFPQRPLSSMTFQEASSIMRELEELEFPFTFRKGRAVALVKIGSIPTMTRLFMATGQSTPQNATKRAVDTKILLQEQQLTKPASVRQTTAIARINYLHTRYRQAGKILDEDLLHTLGDSILETTRAIEQCEWRELTEVERCAMGVFHKSLGDALHVPFDSLPSFPGGWQDGVHFAQELETWCRNYEARAVAYSTKNVEFTNNYIDVVAWWAPFAIRALVRQLIALELDDRVRIAMGFGKPSAKLSRCVSLIMAARKYFLRFCSPPRPRCLAVCELEGDLGGHGTQYNYFHWLFEPWYVKDDRLTAARPLAFLTMLLGRKEPSAQYEKQGYDLRTLGPVIHAGKGVEVMESEMKHIRSYVASSHCPFHGSLRK